MRPSEEVVAKRRSGRSDPGEYGKTEMSRPTERFIEEAKLAGAEVERTSGLDDAVRFVKDFFKKNNIESAIISPELKRRDPFKQEFPDLETGLTGGSLWVEAGLVAADYGIAETGSVVHFDRTDEEKNIWTLPDICLCLLEGTKIVPGLESISGEISGHLSQTTISSPQVSLITGPSRTSDIESQLTIGVHGPSRLVILLMDEM
jgi:L-lactate dehydrogenase complex protein LldG